ncbi:MAG: Mur ligase family protein [Candidatus Eisenbacteria bacterium]
MQSAADLLVIEADESDGSLVRYEPAVGVVLNLQRDHKPEAEVAEMFDTFATRTREALVVGEGANLADLAERTRRRGLPVVVFGFGPDTDVRADESTLLLGPDFSAFDAAGVRFRLPVPGRHNVENALAAIAAGRALGTAPEELVEPLAAYRGVGRRFQVAGARGGIEVIDDFAHNPAKIEAALATARRRVAGRGGGGRDGRVLAVYQPHGYGPTRFLRADFVDAFARALGPEDRAWWLEVFYAGGTARRDFSAADIVADLAARGPGGRVAFAPSREALAAAVTAEARPGDLVLVMGARDPSLTMLARTIVAGLPA